MANVSITVSNSVYSYNTSDSEQAGLDQAWNTVMQALPTGEGQDANTAISERPGYVNSSSLYLQNVISSWKDSNADGDANAMLAQCIASWDLSPPGSNNVIVIPDDSPPTKSILLAYAADKRYRIEIGGVKLGGLSIPTDRDTQAKLTGAFLLAQAAPTMVFPWKTSNGFANVSANQVAQIAVGVGMFVQSAYAAEQAVIVKINTDVIVDQAGIDSFAWPSNS